MTDVTTDIGSASGSASSSVSHVRSQQATRISRASAEPAKPARVEVAAREPDEVEVSLLARYLGMMREAPAIRQELVDDVRGRIAAGSYETPESLDGAVEAMLDEEQGLIE